MSLIGDMTTAVITHINKGMSFKSSFAEVAHQHGIWHYKDEAQYNHIFGRVMIAVKRKIGRQALSKTCKNQPLPVERIDYKKLAANDK